VALRSPEFYRKRFAVENKLNRTILEAIPTNPTIDCMSESLSCCFFSDFSES
jgi:hypothetical protein